MSNTGTHQESVIVAMTGASGAAYGLRLIRRLALAGVPQHILLSDAARVVLKQEADLELPGGTDATVTALSSHLDIPSSLIRCYELNDWFSPAASGSAGIKRMVVIPCSMGSLGRIAAGLSDNLIERAADVILKERRQLILVPRETPLSSIHLENMLKLSRLGVDIMPAMPAFYHRPQSLEEITDFLVDRVFDHLNISNPEAKQWGTS
ncbi:4-hydroxy-3-polyprenylbenzoate decarboxylase [Mariprofundus aestuarium]|uniref:Flavin prenyltransferase UbiX n=1 Tax=Mariprofundus aestuarium TaxID=1921086 RepID=A0A2K8KX66_MARES|nr:flavin prenyltransferase UbiX [Mariprofundus aestuarium]ATX79488.1 4-hydroxy-3-polyprenylbenzoate decarboxylase [Mariprofundus aestuarium]